MPEYRVTVVYRVEAENEEEAQEKVSSALLEDADNFTVRFPAALAGDRQALNAAAAFLVTKGGNPEIIANLESMAEALPDESGRDG